MSALTVRGLRKSFGGLQVTRGVNLNIEPGERRLIIGPNGAGKTTLVQPDYRRTRRPTPARSACSAKTSRACRAAAAPHLGMARTYQIITLFPHDTIIHNVRWLCSACRQCGGTR